MVSSAWNTKVMGEINKKFWKDLIAYFPSYDTNHIQNEAPNVFPILGCNFFTEPLPSKDRIYTIVTQIVGRDL
jgi:hypothetical protein